MSAISLALKNIKKSVKDYSIYFITLLIAVCIFYIFNSIDSQTAMLSLSKSKSMNVQALVQIIGYLSVFVAFVLGFLIIYANNFIIKRRKKEVGLYMILGMSKIKVSTILVLETIFIGLASLVLGLLCGVGLSQVVSIFTAHLFEADMTKFQFVFSLPALLKTIEYFGLIFIVVVFLNVITLSRFKLIDLLKAGSINETIKVKNGFLMSIIFIVSLGLIGYAYHLLFNDALLSGDETFIIMLASGAIGTYLFIYSVSSFLLKLVQLRKKTYYKGLNMFVLKQMNSSINSHVMSMTVISLMLLLTIGILSTSLSLASSMNAGSNEMYPYDFIGYVYSDTGSVEALKNDPLYKDKVSKDFMIDKYQIDELTYQDFMTPEGFNDANGKHMMDGSMSIMFESDFNKLMEFYNQDTVNVSKNTYALIDTLNISKDYYNDFLKEDGKITIGNQELTPTHKSCLEVWGTDTSYEEGLVILDDSYKDIAYPYTNKIVGMFNSKMTEDEAEEFGYNLYDKCSAVINTKVEMLSTQVSSSAMFTFIGLYLGITFAVASGTTLAIEQLSQSSNNIERYKILRQLGASKSMVSKSLFVQIGLSFLFPLVIGLTHSFVGITEISELIKLMVTVDITNSIIYTTLFIVLVYGGYFLVTYFASNRIINEHE